MHDGIRQLQAWLKKALATTLFLFLILGAGAAAVSALAAAMNALTGTVNDGTLPVVSASQTSNVQVSVPVETPQTNQTAVTSAPSVQPQPSLNSSETNTLQTNELATSPVQSNPSVTNVPAGNQSPIDHMYSPVGEMIDSGGFALGNRLEQGFGSLLSGLLQTLFIERNDSTSNEVNHG